MIGIIGLGFVGGAMFKSFSAKKIKIIGYDKYKNGGVGTFEDCLKCDILFLCLPTLFNPDTHQYDKSSIHEVCIQLHNNKYSGIVVIKSTVEPETTSTLASMYSLKFVHNPEFLTARTAFKDFHTQKHVVLGKSVNCTTYDMTVLKDFYHIYYPNADISVCSSDESECMKIFVNSFYASKLQILNEYYLLCEKIGMDYNKIKSLMLKNGWINPMHTNIPGHDGKLSYGGSCFPKDTNALCSFMKKKGTLNMILDSVIKERNNMRDEIYH